MKHGIKILTWLLAALLALLLGLTVFIKVKFPPEKVKALIIQHAERRLHREVKLEKVSISLWRGLSLAGFQLSERPNFAAGTFAAVDNLSVRPEISGLLRGQFLISRVDVESPRIQIIKNPDGSFNFSEPAEPEKAAGAPAGPAPNGGGAAPALFIGRLFLNKGFVSYEERGPAPMDFQIKNLDLAVSNFTPAAPFMFDGSFDLEGRVGQKPVMGKAAAKGSVSLSNGGKVGLGKLDLQMAKSRITSVSFELINFSTPAVKASLRLEPLEIASFGAFYAPPAALRDARAEGDLVFDGGPRSGRLTGAFGISFSGISFKLRTQDLSFEGLPEAVRYKGTLDLSAITIDNSPLAPQAAVSGLGVIAALSGTPDTLAADVVLAGDEADVRYGTLFQKSPQTPLGLKAKLKIEPARTQKDKSGEAAGRDLLLESAEIATTGLRARARGTIGDISGAGRLNLAVQAAQIDLAALRPYSESAASYKMAGQASADLTVGGTYAAPQIQGSVNLKNASALPVEGVKIDGASGVFRFAADSVETAKLTAKLNGSPLTVKMKARDFSNMELDLDASLDQLDAGALLAAFGGTDKQAEPAAPAAASSKSAAPAKPPLRKTNGKIKIGSVVHPHYLGKNFQLAWKLTDAGPDMGRANGTAEFSAADGKIYNIPLAAKINKVAGKDASEITYSKMSGRFTVKDGLLETQDFAVDSSQSDIFVKGGVHMVSLQSNLRAIFKLPSGSIGGSIGQWTADESGRPTIEAVITGRLSDPDFKIDPSKAIKKAGQELIKKGLEKFLGKESAPAPTPAAQPTGTGSQAAPEAAPEQKEPEKEILDKGLKSLEKWLKKK